MSKNMGDSANVVEILRQHFGDDGGRMHTGVEIGTHRGATAAKLLQQFPNLMLWCVDSYRAHKPKPGEEPSDYYRSGDSISRLTHKQQHENYLAAKAATAFAADRCQFCKFPSLEAVRIIPTPKLSFCFIDGSHAYSDVAADIAAWWPRIEARGVLAGHDYLHPRDGKQFGVKQAVTEFAEKYSLQVKVLGTVWWTEKA